MPVIRPGFLAQLRQSAFARPFESAELEQAYWDDCARRFADQRRANILAGAIIWLAYIYWDIKSIEMAGDDPRIYQLVVGMRIGAFLFMGALVIATAGEWFRRSERLATVCLSISSFVIFALAYWQLRVMPIGPSHEYYGPGVMIVISYTLSALRLPARTVSLLLLTYIVSPMVLITIEAWLSTADLAAEQYYIWRFTNMLVGTGLLSAGIAHQLERAQRAAFLHEHELGKSNEAFRRQSQELQQLNEEIRLASRQSEEKALALIDLKDKLRVSAERKNREKSQFLASAVHDLRQPLQAIGNALEPARLCVARGDTASAVQMLELAQRASTLMAEQLAAMLEMSRLESGFVSASIDAVDLAAITATSLSQLAEGAAKDGVRLRVEMPAAQVWVKSDRHFLGRILRNLIGNGVKYCDPAKGADCEVCVRLINLPACVRLEVQDNGLGIAAEHLADGSIFRPFYQVDSRLPQADKGVGLGLSIVGALMALLPEHHLDVESAPGIGTRMILTMPHGPAQIIEAAADAHAVAVESTVQLAGAYVVLVEDDEMVSTSMVLLLAAHGAIHETVTSFEAFEGLLAGLERTPDLVLTDFRLPNHRTAIDICRAARAFDEQLEILVLTGEALSPATLEALAPATVLYKPVPAVELIRVIDARVARASHAAAES